MNRILWVQLLKRAFELERQYREVSRLWDEVLIQSKDTCVWQSFRIMDDTAHAFRNDQLYRQVRAAKVKGRIGVKLVVYRGTRVNWKQFPALALR